MDHFFITRTPWRDEKPWQDSRDEKPKVRGYRLWSPGTIWHLKRKFECFNSRNYSSDGNDIKRLTRHVDGLLYSPGLRGHASSSWLSAYLPCYLRVWQELGMERRQIKKWWGNLRESASQFLAIEVSGVAGWPTTGQIRRPIDRHVEPLLTRRLPERLPRQPATPINFTCTTTEVVPPEGRDTASESNGEFSNTCVGIDVAGCLAFFVLRKQDPPVLNIK